MRLRRALDLRDLVERLVAGTGLDVRLREGLAGPRRRARTSARRWRSRCAGSRAASRRCRARPPSSAQSFGVVGVERRERETRERPCEPREEDDPVEVPLVRVRGPLEGGEGRELARLGSSGPPSRRSPARSVRLIAGSVSSGRDWPALISRRISANACIASRRILRRDALGESVLLSGLCGRPSDRTRPCTRRGPTRRRSRAAGGSSAPARRRRPGSALPCAHS